MKRITKFNRTIYKFLTRTMWKNHFSDIGKKAMVFNPMQIDSRNGIELGDAAFVASGAWLLTIKDNISKIRIGNETSVGHYSHIVALDKVEIGNKVLIADRVFISDCDHQYQDTSSPVMDQAIKLIKPVSIGDESWIGENVCICGSSIGKHCVVGSNSVVTRDIPDYCVAVGAPARIVKRYNEMTKLWEKVNE